MSLNDVVESYRYYLQLHESLQPRQKALAHFENRLKASPEAAKVEAAMFAVLRAYQLNPQLSDLGGSGGVDFLCSNGQSELVVEVTSISREHLDAKSGLQREIESDTWRSVLAHH